MRWDRPPMFEAVISLPSWVSERVDFSIPYATDEDRMQLAIRLAQENVERGTGGPFGAAVFERGTGQLVSVGVNMVVRLNNCTLHAEMMAFQLAQKRVASYTLAGDGGVSPAHELFTSCAPCAMCLGATLWSGVSRLVCGASREDAEQLDFDEGPVFSESYAYLAKRGVEVVRDLLRADARKVIERYHALGGEVYNGVEREQPDAGD
ncbi:MAG TPA: nucleoside deaminase [Gemmatimonadaceae bacterium]|nr:nucleoside deaminase [Gemmatimonadaceae bacterium]